MVVVVENVLPTARSGLLSPLKSATASVQLSPPTAYDRGGWNVPSPLPTTAQTLLNRPDVTAKSVFPSRLKSPTATPAGEPGMESTGPGWNVPSPRPSNTAAVFAS